MISLTFSTFSKILCDGSCEVVEVVLALATILLLVLLLGVLLPLLLYYDEEYCSSSSNSSYTSPLHYSSRLVGTFF